VTANLDELLARARQHDPEAARALADLVEERLLRRRGGDRQADHRRRRDEAIRALARLTGYDRSAERQARDLGQRLARYRPMPGETSPDRILIQDHRQGAWRAAAGSASAVVVNDDLVLRVGPTKASLSPSQAFTLAEQLIRDATRAIIVEKADRAAVLDTLRARDRSAR
jgi:ABC-type hemin transport system substrate-binding protein